MIQVVCYQCGDLVREIECAEDGLSHGLCHPCYIEEMKRLQELQMEWAGRVVPKEGHA